MAQRKPTKTEIFINILFWAAMTISVVGLFIYGAYQIYLKTHDKPSHYFRLGSKKSTSSPQPSQEEETQLSEQLPENSTNEILVTNCIDQVIKDANQNYDQNLRMHDTRVNFQGGKYDTEPRFEIDITPRLLDLNFVLNKLDSGIYQQCLAARQEIFKGHLQKKFNVYTIGYSSNGGYYPQGDYRGAGISVENRPDEMKQFYYALADNPLYTSYKSENFFKLLIELSINKHNSGDLIIDIAPQALIGHTYYQFANDFIQRSGNPDHKKAIEQNLIDKLKDFLSEKYQINLQEGAVITQDEIGKLQKDFPNMKIEIKHSDDPNFSALKAKRIGKKGSGDVNQSRSVEDTEETDKSDPNKDSDSQSFGSK